MKTIKQIFKKLVACRLSLVACNGFTIIELLVVMSVMVVLASGLFASQYSVREQSNIMQDQYKILSGINNAKSLTLGAFMREEGVCGYGFYFEKPKTFILYRDKLRTVEKELANSSKRSLGEVCGSLLSNEHNQSFTNLIKEEKISCFKLSEYKSLGQIDTEDTDDVINCFELNPTSEFTGSDNISVAFLAPYLATFISEGGSNFVDEITIRIKASKSGVEGGIKINKFGQVTTE